MPRGKQDKLYRSFNKGLITEAGFLTYPEDASTDELNTIIYQKGNRSRRPGINYEYGSTGSTYDPDLLNSSVTEEFFWKAPGGNYDVSFFVVQIGHIIYFYSAAIVPLINGLMLFTVDLNDFASPTATPEQINTARVHMASGKGYLFVAGEFIDPFVVTYSYSENDITTTRIEIQMRDFDGMDDGIANDEEPATLSGPHHYNLLNQGWVTPGTAVTPAADGGTPSTSEIYYNPWKGRTRYGDYGEVL